MASLPSPQVLHPFPSLSPLPSASRRPIPLARAAEPDNESAADAATPETDDFEDRLAQVRLRYRSGVGKKAEQRKAKKSGSLKKKGAGAGGVFLPPVPLTEPVSGGLKVDFGFSPYTERLNGRLAMLSLAALLLVELGSGKSIISYHPPATILIQVYFVSAMAALYVKYEKERVSIWPERKQQEMRTP